MNVAWCAVLLAGCGRVGFDPRGSDGGSDTAIADGSDAGKTICVPSGEQSLTASGASTGISGLTIAPFTQVPGGSAAAWADLRSGVVSKLYTASFDEDGGRIGADREVTTSMVAETCPTIASVPGGLAVAWVEEPSNAWRIAIVGSSSTGPAGPVSDAPSSTFVPHGLFATASRMVAVSSDARTGRGQLFLSRLDLDGAKTGADVNVSIDPAVSDQLLGAVAHDGELAILYFHNAVDSLKLGRRSLDGAVLGVDAAFMPALGGLVDAGIAWGDGRHAVAWPAVEGPMAYKLYVAQVDAALQPLGPPVAVMSSTSVLEMPDIAYLGDGVFGVVWRVNGNGFAFDRIDSRGQVLGPRATGGSATSARIAISAVAGGGVISWQDSASSLKYMRVCP